jgi:UDP-glucose 4-epimerase
MGISLVTGGAGFIGSHLATALVKRGDRVRVLDNLSTGFRENLDHVREKVEWMEGDVRDEATVARAVKQADCVFHQAALASVPRSVECPRETHEVCVTGTLNLLRAARKAGVRRFVYAASSSAYGDQASGPRRETDLPQPLSPYAAAKLAGEMYCRAFYQTYELQTVIVRYFNVFGPRQDPGSEYSAVIPIFVTRLLSGKQPVIYGDGYQSRDFTYVDNVVRGNLLAAETPEAAGQTLNIASGSSTTLLELLRIIGQLLSVSVEPVFDQPRPGDVRESLADIALARDKLGYEPTVTLEDGLRRSIDYYRSIAGC